MNFSRWLACAIGLGAMIDASAASAQDVAKFYEGQQLRIIVGTGASGSFYNYGRLVGRFMGNHIPGKPTFIVQAMPGASGIKAVNYLYAVAPKDGTLIGTFNSAMPFYQMMGQTGIQFKSDELSWIGSASRVVSTFIVWHTAGVRNIEEAKTKEVIMGASGAAGTTATYPALVNEMLGTKFKIVTGYEAGNMINLALESGEVQGRGGAYWSSYKTAKPDWIQDGKIVPILQVGTAKDADLPHVPLLTELAQNDEQRQIFEFVSSNHAFEYPFAAPPGIPSDRLNAMRRAFDQTMTDGEFLAQAEKQVMIIEPLSGEALQKVVQRINATPPAIVAKTREAMTVRGVTERAGSQKGAGED